MLKKSKENALTFLKLILDARKKSGFTQEKLAAKLKKNQSYISKYENGDRRLDVLEFMDAMHALNVDPVEIISDLEKSWKK